MPLGSRSTRITYIRSRNLNNKNSETTNMTIVGILIILLILMSIYNYLFLTIPLYVSPGSYYILKTNDYSSYNHFKIECSDYMLIEHSNKNPKYNKQISDLQFNEQIDIPWTNHIYHQHYLHQNDFLILDISNPNINIYVLTEKDYKYYKSHKYYKPKKLKYQNKKFIFNVKTSDIYYIVLDHELFFKTEQTNLDYIIQRNTINIGNTIAFKCDPKIGFLNINITDILIYPYLVIHLPSNKQHNIWHDVPYKNNLFISI